MLKKGFLLGLLLTFMAAPSWAQYVLKGKVVDAEHGASMPGVNVRIEGSTIGTATNSKGEFVLKGIPEGKHILRCSFLGYRPTKITVSEKREGMIIKMRPSHIDLDQVVVTGTGTHHRLKNSPIPVEVLSQKKIKQLGTQNLSQLLSSFSPSLGYSESAMGSSLTLNGLRNKFILILVDGHKVTGDTGGDIDFDRVNISNIKRIEILKGAASSLYGSEAMGGVINIITDKPKNKVSVDTYTRYSKYNQLTQSVNAALNFGILASYTSFQHQHSDGWQNVSIKWKSSKAPKGESADSYRERIEKGDYKEKEVTQTERQTSGKFNKNSISQRFELKPNKDLMLYARGEYYHKKLDRPKSEYYYNMFYNDYNLGLGGRQLLNKTSYLSLDLHNDNYEYGKLYIKENKKDQAAEGDKIMTKRQHYYSGNLKGVIGTESFGKITVGAEGLLDQLKRPDSFDDVKQAYTVAFYLQDELKINNLQIVPGFRYIYHENFKSHFSPKLSLMYRLKDFNIRASYAAGFRAPDMRELHLDQLNPKSISQGNPNLNPEINNYYSFGIEFINPFVNISVNGYINRIKDLINRTSIDLTSEDVANGIEQRYLYMNTSKAKVQGVDVNADFYLGGGFSMNTSYSLVDAKDLATDKYLSKSIRHSVSGNLNWGKSWGILGMNANLNGIYRSKRHEDSAWGDAPAHQIWNLNTSYTIRPKGVFIFEPILGIENIFNYVDDRPISSNYATVSPGRTVYLGLIMRFKK